MTTRGSRFLGALIVGACLAGHAPAARAQGVELTPFAGYRFGGGFFEIMSEQEVDLDGAPALGFVLDVPMSNGLSFEALITHQSADVFVAPVGPGRATVWRIAVDHWQGGGVQEFGVGAVRPFMTGMLGLTRFAAEGDNEIRFTVGAGGGVKVFPVRHLGVRLDTRVFATFVDAGGSTVACFPGACLVGLHVNVVWQAEFSAGLVVKFP